MSPYSTGRLSGAVIPLTLHHHLPSLIAGNLASIAHHGLDVEITLDTNARFTVQLDEAKDLVRVAGPNLRGRHISYDGSSIVVWGGA